MEETCTSGLVTPSFRLYSFILVLLLLSPTMWSSILTLQLLCNCFDSPPRVAWLQHGRPSHCDFSVYVCVPLCCSVCACSWDQYGLCGICEDSSEHEGSDVLFAVLSLCCCGSSSDPFLSFPLKAAVDAKISGEAVAQRIYSANRCSLNCVFVELSLILFTLVSRRQAPEVLSLP